MNINEMTLEEFGALIDHTNLKADITDTDLTLLCDEAIQYHFATVAVNPYPVKFCKQYLKGTGIRVDAAIAFPLGQTTITDKVQETMNAINDGADEIDYVLNIGRLKQHDYYYIRDEMRVIVDYCRACHVTSKVIFETCYLNDDEIVQAARIAKEIRPDFIKTSTGFGMEGATVEHVKLMKETVGDLVKVKASGGIRNLKTTLEMIEAGAERIGTSSSTKIMKEFIDHKVNFI